MPGFNLRQAQQWVYLPAVEDASLEAEEAGNTALGKLLQRTVRQKVNFDEALEELRTRTRAEYDALLQKQQGTLQEISESLAKRLALFAHPDASLMVEWLQGSEKSVSIGDARKTIDPGAAGLKKNPMLIGEMLSIAWAEGKKPKVLTDLVARLKAFGAKQEAVA
jgi:putative ATP-dependent endonuclease of the OLD family